MSDITKKITYGELENKEYQALFKFTNGETVLGVINYDNGDVYMGEIKPDEKYDGKRDRRRHGYGKVFPKRGKVVDGEWHLGQVIGKSVTFDKKGTRTVEVRGSNPSFRAILYSYYLTDDNKYGGDNYNGLYKDKFWEGDFKDVLRRGELREQLFNGAPASTSAASSEPKSAPIKEKAPAKKNTIPKETASKTKIERKEFKNGDVYEGEYKDGKLHGQGKYTSSKGWVYEGQFTDGQITGKGKITYASGTVYEGDLIKGIRNGYGRVTYTDGLYYEGGWKDDERHGKSTYTKKLGEFTLVHTGMWDMGKRTGAHDHYSITNPEKKIYRQFYENDEAVGSQFCPVGAYANWTVADAVANAKRMEEENRQFWEDKKAREAAHSSSSSDASSDSDNEAVWEEFEYVEDLIEKLKNPELFDDPEDRWIANAYQYFEAFMDDVAANYSDADFATASEIFANILDLDVNGLQNYLTDKLGYIGDHYYVKYIEACLNYACSHVTKDALIPFANLCYFRTQEIGINYMDLYVKAYSRHYVAKGADILWFERYACNGDGFVSLSDEDDSRGNERGYGDSLRQMLTNGYRMGSDCHLYLPMKSLSEPNASPSVGETYRMYHILSHVYDVGEWSGYSPYEDTDYQTWEHGSFAMDTYMAWMENEDEHTVLFRNDGFTKRTGSRKGDYSKRRVALIPLRNYISDAMLANEQVRKSVPLSERLLYQRKLNEMVEEAMEYVRKGCIGAAFDEFQDAFDGGYEPKRLAEICYDVVRDVLQKNEDHWEFDDPYVEIMKLVALCDPESYAYFMSSIARESFGNYNHKYIYEVLTGEEYPG